MPMDPDAKIPADRAVDLRDFVSKDELLELLEKTAPSCVLIFRDRDLQSSAVAVGRHPCEAFSKERDSCASCLAALMDEASKCQTAVTRSCELGIEETMVAIRICGEAVAYLLEP